MVRKTILLFSLVLVFSVSYAAGDQQQNKDEQAKTLSGMSIVGNDEAPKSLYIVPWKSSEIGVEASLDMHANKDAAPIDREVFKRQLNFYQVSQTD